MHPWGRETKEILPIDRSAIRGRRMQGRLSQISPDNLQVEVYSMSFFVLFYFLSFETIYSFFDVNF